MSVAFDMLVAAAAAPTKTSATPWWTVLPASVSAILTGAAFLVTYRLFRRGTEDRKREQAHLVYATQEVGPRSPGTLSLTVVVHNRSKQPIWHVDVLPVRAGTLQLVQEQQQFPTILPESDHKFELTLRPDGTGYMLDRTPAIRFLDYAGCHWEKIGAVLNEVRGRPVRRRIPTLVHDLVARDRRSSHAA